MKYGIGLLLIVFCSPLVALGYTPGVRDREVMQSVDEKVDALAETGGKEQLVSLFSRVSDAAEDIEEEQALYILEYILQVLATHLQETFSIIVTWDALIDVDATIDTTPKEEQGSSESTPVITSEDALISYDLPTFYATYKGQVTSTTPISELCTKYYDEIDTIAKEYDFPTALIIATRYKEHTCIFENPSNGWGNFQITSHYYPAGAITWEQFENQVINFIVFSKAKRDYYDAVQTFGAEPIALSYDSLDLTSLRKQAIFYNGVTGTLESNMYANQNFDRAASGRDGIVAMTIRALGWQLYGDRSGSLYETADIVEEQSTEDKEDEVEEKDEVEQEQADTDCEEQFTVNLGPDATNPAVLDMQKFLQDEGFYSGDPSGIYDDKTTEAVNAFQAYYKTDILDPGGYTAPTGYWYPATRRKANEVICSS